MRIIWKYWVKSSGFCLKSSPGITKLSNNCSLTDRKSPTDCISILGKSLVPKSKGLNQEVST